ncbi:MAG: exodeoxyribonuclease VII small subunit [Ruminococcaceae bacterium]|nr:exodeoxyribonuclease VII small subunit [Oscillospiraceae bacterium]
MSNLNVNEKFEGMSYEDGLKKLTSLISQMESGKLTFDEMLSSYKEAFEYYDFLCEYLKMTGEKIKKLNEELSSISPATGV